MRQVNGLFSTASPQTKVVTVSYLGISHHHPLPPPLPSPHTQKKHSKQDQDHSNMEGNKYDDARIPAMFIEPNEHAFSVLKDKHAQRNRMKRKFEGHHTSNHLAIKLA